jgi:hypothetical protein
MTVRFLAKGSQARRTAVTRSSAQRDAPPKVTLCAARLFLVAARDAQSFVIFYSAGSEPPDGEILRFADALRMTQQKHAVICEVKHLARVRAAKPGYKGSPTTAHLGL